MVARADDTTPADPEFGWLEDVMSREALQWVRAQNTSSIDQIAADPRFAIFQEEIRKTLDAPGRIPHITKLGAYWYNFWQDAAHPRGLWRRTTLDSYRTASPEWETVLDLDVLAASEGENWIWHGVSCLPPAYQRCIVGLSRGGADADVKREFDLVRKCFVEDGFVLPEAKSRLAWRDIDTVYLSTDFGGEGSAKSMTDSGYPRQARLWRRGTPFTDAVLLFEGETNDVSVAIFRDHTPGFERSLLQHAITFRNVDNYLLTETASGAPRLDKIEIPEDARLSFHREWLFIELRSDWMLGDRHYKSGSWLVAPFDAWMRGERAVELLFAPSDRVSLESCFFTRNYAVLSLLDNVRSRLLIALPPDATRGQTRWVLTKLPSISTFSSIDAEPVDAEQSDDILLMMTDFLTPTTMALQTLGPDPSSPEVIKSSPTFFDASLYEITQNEATSSDGTQIPYFQVSRRGIASDGSHPTLLYGYGGFEVSMTPSYSGALGKSWLEHGGVYVLANLRGGGEFGPSWHQAALRENRHRAYEDFAAIAEHLVARKVTSPHLLGAMGGSNGGLLMGNVLIKYPHLFGAIVCQVPLLDMRRYHRLLAGASWVDEYGNPDDPEQWKFIQTFSPYHLLETVPVEQPIDAPLQEAASTPTARLPPVLFYTSTKDDRVHPGHARKMVAKMLERGHQQVFYYENIEGGHGGAANNSQRAFMSALSWTFLWQHLR